MERILGKPGQSIENSDLDKSRVDAGLVGERAVAKIINKYARSYQNVYVYHSARLPGRTFDLDHVFVVGDEIYIIDTKRWQSNRTYSFSGDYAMRDGHGFPGAELAFSKYRKIMLDWFPRHKVYNVLAIFADNITIDASSANGFTPVKVSELDALLGAAVERAGVTVEDAAQQQNMFNAFKAWRERVNARRMARVFLYDTRSKFYKNMKFDTVRTVRQSERVLWAMVLSLAFLWVAQAFLPTFFVVLGHAAVSITVLVTFTKGVLGHPARIWWTIPMMMLIVPFIIAIER